MKRVVITGATSMIGVALIEKCIQNNIEVLALVRNNSQKVHRIPTSKYVQICHCDLNEMHNFQDYVGSYDVFYHLGWGNTDKTNRFDSIKQTVNIQYSLDAVALAHRLGCKKFIGAGSQAEYGRVDGIIDENTPVNPSMAYGIAKYAAGKLCEIECQKYDLQYIWARIFSVYGSLDNEGTMIRYALETMQKGQPATFSSGEQMWDYLHSDDIGKALYLLGSCNIQQGIYCLASGNAKPLKEFIEIIHKTVNPEAIIQYTPSATLPAGIHPDIKKLKEQTGFEPLVDFEVGIKNMLQL